jgi:hypothetical protein
MQLNNDKQEIPGTPYQAGLLQIRYHVPRIPRQGEQSDVMYNVVDYAMVPERVLIEARLR